MLGIWKGKFLENKVQVKLGKTIKAELEQKKNVSTWVLPDEKWWFGIIAQKESQESYNFDSNMCRDAARL